MVPDFTVTKLIYLIRPVFQGAKTTPNPLINEFLLEYLSLNSKLILVYCAGKKILEQNVKQNVLKLMFIELAAGIYFLNIKTLPEKPIEKKIKKSIK